MTKPVLTMADITKVTLDHLFRNPDAILAGLQCASEAGDEETVINLLKECKERGIDVPKLLQDDLDRHEKLWGKIR